MTNEEIDLWYAEMNELASKIDDSVIAELNAALAEADAIAKEHVRREMGLEP